MNPKAKREFRESAWRDALNLWGVAIDLSPPQAWRPPVEGKNTREQPIAYIDLVHRQIVVNHQKLHEFGAYHALPAVLAHEIGHHIRFPHTLGLSAELELLQQRLLPGRPPLINLFFDLLVNEEVGRTWPEQLQAVYRGAVRAAGGQQSALFTFYLAVYEELWGLEPDTLNGPAAAKALTKAQPVWRLEARVFAQTFWAVPTIHLQFIYFCSRFAPYLPTDDANPCARIPLTQDLPRPDEDDYAAAMNPTAAVDDAVRQARDAGWIEQGSASESVQDPLGSLDALAAGRPGTEVAGFRRRIVSKHYRRLVDQHLFDIPKRPRADAPEPSIPGTTEAWEWGDGPLQIDWLASVRAAGALAVATPLKRTYWVDDATEHGDWIPAIEIYLDTSGSMPDPQQRINPMTLGAQILAAATLRRRGRVRSIIYSHGDPLVSDWMYDESTARDYLLNYSGGGTDFPFPLAARFAREERDVIRIVLSDSDFFYNLNAGDGHALWAQVVEHSSRTVAMLLVPARGIHSGPLQRYLDHPRFRFVQVNGMGDFARTAAELANALFGD